MTRLGPMLILVAVTALPLAAGQSAPPAFEVASVKPNNSGSGSSGTQRLPNGQFIATNTTLQALISLAYGIRGFQITGGPPWLDTDRFDVIAKKPQEGSDDQFALMLQQLLRDRFRLQRHSETRELPVYALVLAKDHLGPQIKTSVLICSGPDAPRPQPGQPSQCGVNVSARNRTSRATGGAQTMAEIAAVIANAAGRPVMNQTRVDGRFDYELRWTLDGSTASSAASDEPPPLFTALQDQLGLKLESSRGPVEVLVIDSVARPMPD